jgi:hypothetical protein
MTRQLKVLVACEFSGTVRRAFAALGHDAWSCDLLPANDNSPKHIVGDCFEVLNKNNYDLMICHPPCTFLSVSGLHWNKRLPLRAAETEKAITFCTDLMAADVPMIAMENPVGCLSTKYRGPDQYIQPYEFGADASKKTCLWLKGLPKLIIDPAKRCNGRWVMWNGKLRERWSNQTDSGQNKLPPSEDRWALRSLTYPEIAQAWAEQWSSYANNNT